MGLDKTNIVDAVGIEVSTGSVVLTIVGSWDCNDEHAHLLALQAKLNSYFDFIEGGQLLDEYPNSVGRKQIIDVITRYPLPANGHELLDKARSVTSGLNVEISTRFIPNASESCGSG